MLHGDALCRGLAGWKFAAIVEIFREHLQRQSEKTDNQGQNACLDRIV